MSLKHIDLSYSAIKSAVSMLTTIYLKTLERNSDNALSISICGGMCRRYMVTFSCGFMRGVSDLNSVRSGSLTLT